MRRVSYVPIDAAKHRSSRSRVPGLRAGHSFMWSRPFPNRPIARCAGPCCYCCKIKLSRETVEVRAFDDQLREKFVLSPTVHYYVRAFDDQTSCFRRPNFVLSTTDCESGDGDAWSSVDCSLGAFEQWRRRDFHSGRGSVTSDSSIRLIGRGVDQLESEVRNGVLVDDPLQLKAEVFQRGLIAKL
jgi:hypothetical protein